MNGILQGESHVAECINDLVSKYGPDKNDCADLGQWFVTVANLVKEEKLPRPSKQQIVDLFGSAMSPKTMQGWALNTPHGYHGDFRIIDKTYTHWITDDNTLEKWDRYYHSHSAPNAVRNRKAYFKKLLRNLDRGFLHRSVIQDRIEHW